MYCWRFYLHPTSEIPENLPFLLVGDRYYSNKARVVAVICALFISFTYVAGRLRGWELSSQDTWKYLSNGAVVIGMCIVFFYAVLGGMKALLILKSLNTVSFIFAFMVPAIFISMQLTGINSSIRTRSAVSDGTYLLGQIRWRVDRARL